MCSYRVLETWPNIPAIELGFDGCVSGELADPASFPMLRVFSPLLHLVWQEL